ncbi:MAG TPA: sulfite exporter TauE/SafE family protein [Dehalococcoidia bacterium]|nr:sulfite exporter TauE/SafE family protein [Dehalococcoidia bacterium]
MLPAKERTLRGALTGAAGGLFSGLTGVGGGAVMVPMLVGLLRLSQHRAHGTSLAIIVFVASAAAVPYALAGNIDWPLAGMLAAGAALGVYAGARAMQRIPARQLRVLFGLFLLATSIRLLIG